MVIALFAYLVAQASWLGSIVFFSFVTAPTVFGSLPRAEAGKVISAIFPRYYMVGYIAGTVCVMLAIYLMAVREPRLWWGAATFALALALGITFYAGTVILPRADSIRIVAEDPTPDPARKAEFDKLHRLSVILNGAVLLLNLAAIASTTGALTSRG